MKIFTLFLTLFLSFSIFSQSLMSERIWKLSSRKRSIFFDKGVFHSDVEAATQKLKSVRNSYVPARGYERIVFDFTSNSAPRIYGHISKEGKKLYIDFFNVEIGAGIQNLKDIKYLDRIDFINIDKNNLTAELKFKNNVSFDIFYLENPGRVVVDVKK